MPLYWVEYGCDLTKSQRQALANGITKLHHETYSVPSFFVSVTFTNISVNEIYSGGREVIANRIFATVRTGGSRTAESFDKLCLDLLKVWDSVMFKDTSLSAEKKESSPLRLTGVFVLRSIDASYEEGGLLPHAGRGEDEKWMRNSLSGWQKRAEGGDEAFQGVVKDVESVLHDK